MIAATVIFSPQGIAVRQRLARAEAGRMLAWAPLFAFVLLAGCSRFREHPQAETVYVVAQTYLRDRIAPIATNVAQVTNGEALEVIEHDRRFYRVKTPAGATGWIEDHLVISQAVYDQFAKLEQQHAHDPVVATGVLRDSLYMHLSAGRETDRFYLLPENDKLQLLVRASLARQTPETSTAAAAPPAKTSASGPGSHPAAAPAPAAAAHASSAPAQPVVLEDWWLARDMQGHVGWLLARRLDVDVPDEIGQYSEGQKMIGAYVLTKVFDPESSLPGNEVPEYLAVLNPYKDGLPYDFNQFRVFTWDVKKHRYETAYRQRDIEGYLPVEIDHEKVDNQTLPVFSIRVATSDGVVIDPATGAARPAQSEVVRYALEGPIVKRISDATVDTAVHPPGEHPAGARGEQHAPTRRRRR
ncbi:MAG TPA: SH3 domain-containing protein [Acidobacteriaceae bacterium]|nr:SH3 domain-containing protein [Acidobacteriaceae bacterium]